MTNPQELKGEDIAVGFLAVFYNELSQIKKY